MTAAQIHAAKLSLRCNPHVDRLTRATLIGQLHATAEPDLAPDSAMLAWQESVYANGLGNTVHAW